MNQTLTGSITARSFCVSFMLPGFRKIYPPKDTISFPAIVSRLKSQLLAP